MKEQIPADIAPTVKFITELQQIQIDYKNSNYYSVINDKKYWMLLQNTSFYYGTKCQKVYEWKVYKLYFNVIAEEEGKIDGFRDLFKNKRLKDLLNDAIYQTYKFYEG